MLPVFFTSFKSEELQKKRTTISSERIAALETSKVLSVGEKVHLVLLLSGQQRICDIGVGQPDLRRYEHELSSLNIAFRHMKTGSGERWILAGFNEAILEYIETRWERLSEIEAGIFYGYPATSTLAFSQILKPKRRKPETAAAFYLGGVYSQEYFDEEIEYLEELWQLVWNTSPAVAHGAEESYKDIIRNKN